MESAMNYKLWEKKADVVIRLRNHMRYIGVFALDGDLIAHAGAPGVQEDFGAETGDTTRVLNTQIGQIQAKAVVDHMKCPSIGIAKIDVAHLEFVCFNQGTNNMIGMSSFNVETSDEAIWKIDQACFKMSRRRYSRIDSLQGRHHLNIAATLWKDVVIIGIGLPGNVSCLSAVHEMTKPDILLTYGATKDVRRSMDELRNMEKGNDIVAKLTENKPHPDPQKHDKQTRKSNEVKPELSEYNKDTFVGEMIENTSGASDNRRQDIIVQKRPDNIRRTKSFDDVLDINAAGFAKEEYVDERVKSATIRSIEALRNIGPFTGTLILSDDENSELMRSKSTELLIQKKKTPKQSRSKSIGSADPSSRFNRRPSRATMV